MVFALAGDRTGCVSANRPRLRGAAYGWYAMFAARGAVRFGSVVVRIRVSLINGAKRRGARRCLCNCLVARLTDCFAGCTCACLPAQSLPYIQHFAVSRRPAACAANRRLECRRLRRCCRILWGVCKPVMVYTRRGRVVGRSTDARSLVLRLTMLPTRLRLRRVLF